MTKYRIWDKFNKEFIDLEHTDRNLSIDPISGKVMETEISTGELDNYLLDWLVPVVFTGLHDKHGKELYEGDVLRVTEYSGDELFGYNSPVEFIDSGYLVTEPNGTQVPLACFHNQDNAVNPLIEIEITGNIYENPELLEESE